MLTSGEDDWAELVSLPQDDDGEFGSDAALLADLRRGNLEAAGPLAGRHRAEALTVARRLVDPVTAEDLVSGAFERVFRLVLAGGGPVENLRPYLMRAVRNGAGDFFRARREFASELVTWMTVAPAGDAIDDSILIREAFGSLPERWRQVLWLTYVAGWDRIDVGVHLGLRPESVPQLAYRARKGLGRVLLEAGLAKPDRVSVRVKTPQR